MTMMISNWNRNLKSSKNKIETGRLSLLWTAVPASQLLAIIIKYGAAAQEGPMTYDFLKGNFMIWGLWELILGLRRLIRVLEEQI